MPRSSLMHKRARPVKLAYRLADALTARLLRARPALVVSGFWRSGTTWLLEAVASGIRGRSLFEPLQPRAGYLSALVFPGAEADWKQCFMPWAPNKLPRPLADVMERALHGRLHNLYVLRHRTVAELFSSRVVVKFVRAALCLGALKKAYQVPVLHLYRDPRAVLASVLRGGPSFAFLSRLSLRDQLLEVPDGRASYFSRWQPEIDRLDQGPPHQRIAFYWAATERCLRDHLPGVTLVAYEQLLTRGPALLRTKLLEAGVRQSFEAANLDVPSSTTARGRVGLTSVERAGGWNSELTASQAADVKAIVSSLGLDEALAPES